MTNVQRWRADRVTVVGTVEVMSAPAPDLVEHYRLRLQRGVRRLVTGSSAPSLRVVGEGAEPSLFGPASVTWRVHADASMFIGGLRSLLLQTLHPATMQGVADHSDYKHDSLGRLRRTANFVGTTTFAPASEARLAIEAVRVIHERVTGTLPDGTPYRANDSHLLGWVHATEVDSFLRAYRRYGRPSITDAEADRYVDEMATVARLLGVIDPPIDRASLRRTLARYRSELKATPAARDAVRFLLWPPFPRRTRPIYGVIASASLGLLPGYAQRMLWLPLPLGVEPIVVRPAAAALTRTLDWAMQPAS